MALTVSDFHSLVSDEANRGTTLDGYIPSAVRRLVQFLERDYSYQYMHRFNLLTVYANANQPRAVAFPNDYVKSIEFLRFRKSDGKYVKMLQIQPGEDIEWNDSSLPRAYWLDGTSYLWLDSIGSDNLEFEISYYEYTDWPSDTSQTHWLLNHAEDVLLAGTMMFLGPYAREPEWMQTYKSIFDAGLLAMKQADVELQEGGGVPESYVMRYKG